MQKRLVQMFAVVVAFLGVAGLFVESGHLFDLMNANIALDILRLGLAAYLIYAGFFTDSARIIKSALLTFTMLYLGLAVLGMIDSRIWGLLPAGLTGFDIAFHLVAGLVAGAAAMSIKENRTAIHA
jgi:hypothetical protein